MTNTKNEDCCSIVEFTEKVAAVIREKLGEKYLVTVKQQLKNNSTRLEGLLIRREDENLAPTLYINDYYARFLDGEAFDRLIKEIIENYYCCEKPDFAMEGLLGGSQQKFEDKVFFKLINRDLNEELLEYTPHGRYLDFAVTYHIHVASEDNTVGSILITDNNIRQFGFEEKDLYRLALKNTPRLFPMQVRNMGELIKGLSGIEDELPEEFGKVCDYPMFVVSNTRLMNGAACLLYPEFKQEIASRLPNGYYILPSSIHELIVVPSEREADDLLQMVYDVNRTQVPKEDFLSDNIYMYQLENDEFKIFVNDESRQSA